MRQLRHGVAGRFGRVAVVVQAFGRRDLGRQARWEEVATEVEAKGGGRKRGEVGGVRRLGGRRGSQPG